MQKVIFYTKEVCSLCDEAYALLKMFQNDYSFEIETRDIETNDEWLEEYQLLIPVVQINDTVLNCEEIDFSSLENALKRNVN